MEFFLALALLFFVLNEVVGILVTAFISSILLLGWIILGRRALISGLIKSDVQAYFDARAKSADHDKAMGRVVEHRFPFSLDNRSAVRALLHDIPPQRDEEDDLKMLVYAIMCHEAGKSLQLNGGDKILRKVERIIRFTQYPGYLDEGKRIKKHRPMT